MSQTLETGFRTTLALKLDPADVTMTVVVVPTVTKGRLFLKSGSQKEWIKYTGVSGTTLTGLVRGLSQTADPSTAGTGLTWLAGTQVVLVEMHDQMSDKQEGMPVKVYATTAARDSDITSPSNGMQCYVTADGTFYDYVAGAWTARANGTNVNASATVAGRVEIATTAQSKSATDTGETGALLSVLPSDIAKNTQSGTFVYGTDAGGDDTYVVALTPVLASYTAGQRLTFTPTTANTGACSVDFGPGVLNIKTKDGNDPQTGVIRASKPITGTYDGTNFIIDNEDFATDTNKGLVEKATDAEAITGTDTERYITPKQAKDNYLNYYKGGNTLVTTNGSPIVITHSLGIIPKKINFTIAFGGSIVGSATRNEGTINYMTINGGNIYRGTGYIINDGNYQIGISSVTSTQFTLTPNDTSPDYNIGLLYDLIG